MNQSHPLISVIIPVYNGECYLEEALKSVLAQSYQPIEIIVVDDGSTDRSAAVAQRFYPAVRLIRQPNLGASMARNRGVAAASGAFLAFLDADDLWGGNHKLRRQMQALMADPDLVMVFGQVEQFYSPELGEKTTPPALGERHTLAGLHVGTMLIRRSAFEAVGPFDAYWQVAHFIDWYARAQKIGLKSLVLPEVMMKRRIHTTNLGIRAAVQARLEYVRLMKVQIDQHRLTSTARLRATRTAPEQMTMECADG